MHPRLFNVDQTAKLFGWSTNRLLDRIGSTGAVASSTRIPDEVASVIATEEYARRKRFSKHDPFVSFKARIRNIPNNVLELVPRPDIVGDPSPFELRFPCLYP